MNGTRAPSGGIAISLRYDEAVVLSELLSRWERDGAVGRLPLVDQAEQRILSDLTATFEPLIDEVFDGDQYANLLSRSRSTVRDSSER